MTTEGIIIDLSALRVLTQGADSQLIGCATFSKRL